MIRFCLILVASGLFFGTLMWSLAQDRPVEMEQGISGEEAPELQVEEWHQLPEGKEKLTIKDYDGKVLIMLFWQSTSKGALDEAFPRLKKLVDHYGADHEKVKFLAVQTAFNNLLDNTPEKMAAMAEQFELGIPFGHWTYTASFPGMGGLRGTYKSPHTPWFVVIGPDRKVLYNGTLVSVDFAIENIDDLIK